MKPILFEISETNERLVSHSGLALVGALLASTQLRQRCNGIRLEARPYPEIPHGDVISAMLGLLCLGQPDFEAIEAFRGDVFFCASLGLQQAPSSPTLRQRIEELSEAPAACASAVLEESARLLKAQAPRLTPCWGRHVPLDVDVSVFDNSKTKKEGVSWTYQKVDGYAPIFAHLGQEGYLIHSELRVGSQHCQQETPEFLDQALALAREATRAPLLVRMDSGNDALDNVRACRKRQADWIIKRNLRRESEAEWLEIAQAYGTWTEPRPGKVVMTGETRLDRENMCLRAVFRVTQRTIRADGQRLLGDGEIEIETYWTSLKAPPEEVIELYHQHGTSEQFHAELKTDLDLERLPSGKFAANALVLRLGLLAYNLLRLIGQRGLKEERALPEEEKPPMRKKVKRRRVKSVMQDLMYMAARLTRHAGRWGLTFWRENPWRHVWQRLYRRFTETVPHTG